MPSDTGSDDLTFRKRDFDVRQAFATPVILAPMDQAAALNAVLLPTILGREAASAGVVRSNRGGWQSTDDFAAWSGEAGASLVTAAVRLADSLTARQGDAGLDRVAVNWKINAWANVNRDGHGNAAHHHPGCFWSCVYWVQTGEAADGGEFEIQDPRGILPGFVAPHPALCAPRLPERRRLRLHHARRGHAAAVSLLAGPCRPPVSRRRAARLRGDQPGAMTAAGAPAR